MDPVFRSKVDVWLVLALVGVPILALEFLLDGGGADLMISPADKVDFMTALRKRMRTNSSELRS